VLITIIAAGLLVIACVILLLSQNNKRWSQTSQRRGEALAKYEGYLARRALIRASIEREYPFVAFAKIDDTQGVVCMDEQGKCLVLFELDEFGAGDEAEPKRAVPVTDIVSLSVEYAHKSKTVKQRERVPLAVRPKRSPVARALVGGVLAGPVGAMVGGMSGLSGGSDIKYGEVSRMEKVSYEGDPTIILDVDNLSRPQLSIKLESRRETDEWLSRLKAAMHRATA